MIFLILQLKMSIQIFLHSAKTLDYVIGLILGISNLIKFQNNQILYHLPHTDVEVQLYILLIMAISKPISKLV